MRRGDRHRRGHRLALRQHPPLTLLRFIGAALGSFAVAMTVATLSVLLLTTLLSVPIADAVVAFAPGAQDTMMVLALALHLDPVFVGALHLSRFLLVSLLVPFLAYRLRKDRRSRGASGRPAPAGRPSRIRALSRKVDSGLPIRKCNKTIGIIPPRAGAG